MLLPDHLGQKLGTPLAIKYLGHFSLYYTLKQAISQAHLLIIPMVLNKSRILAPLVGFAVSSAERRELE